MTTSLLKSAARALLFAFAALLGAGQAAAQTVEYVHTDALGSVVAVTNAAGVVIERREYEPYGLQLTPAVQNGPGYTAHVQDAATGLTYMQQRYYDPLLGRFLSVDPVTMHDTGDPRHFARYGYANNNPYAFVDPDGRQSCDPPCKIYGKAQTTGGADHAPAGQADAERWAESGTYRSVHLNQRLSTVTGDQAAGNQRPDVAGVRRDNGGVDTIEHPSPSQTVASQDAKGADMQQKLTAIGRGGSHETRTTTQALKAASARLGTTGVAITVGVGVIELASDPTPENANSITGEIVTGAICGLMGGCGDAHAPEPMPDQ